MTERERQTLNEMVVFTKAREKKAQARQKILHQERIGKALQEVRRLAIEFRLVDPALRGLFLFGSLARGEPQSRDFDIDLAVESERYLDLIGVAMDSLFKVDLVDLPFASTYLQAVVQQDGVPPLSQATKIFRLVGELKLDSELVKALVATNERAWIRVQGGASDELDFAALGYTLHNLYSLFEGYALRIAKTFENNLDQEMWHRDLLRRMQIEIPRVRPQVWDSDLVAHLDELRRFRHAFRHIYETQLDPQKVQLVQGHVIPAYQGFKLAHEAFLEKLMTLGESLD